MITKRTDLNKFLYVYKEILGMPLLLVKDKKEEIYLGFFNLSNNKQILHFKILEQKLEFIPDNLNMNIKNINNVISVFKQYYLPEIREIIIDRIFFEIIYL